MASTISQLRSAYRNSSSLMRLIWINSALFILLELSRVLLTLLNIPAGDITGQFLLPSSLSWWIRQPWSLVTYMFLHDGFLHLFLNMLWLWWGGRLFMMLFCQRQLTGLYLLGGLAGGLAFMTLYNLFPFYASLAQGSLIVGSSASVLAIVTAVAVRAPSYRVPLAFLGTFRLSHMAAGIILLDLLLLTDGNSGGHLAHLGGAISGFMFSWSLKRGHDLTRWITALIEFPFQAWRFMARRGQAGGQARNQRNERASGQNSVNSKEINEILRIVRESGYHSLTPEQKRTLFTFSEKK